MLKLMGAALLVGGCGAVGFSAAGRLARRVGVLRALLGALEGMERELSFRLTPMPELLERAAESPPPAGEMFARCRARLDELGERPLSQLWRESVEDTPLGLTGPALLALEELGDVLGRYDGEEQRAALARTRAELGRALEQAREESEKQGRMYRALGLTAGAMLAILLL